MRRGKKIIIAVIILCFAFAAVAFIIINKPHENVVNQEADLTISAENLYNDYALDETKADKMYMNKVIEVKGKVLTNTNDGNNHFILLNANSTGGINCQLMMNDASVLDKINKNDEVIIKGKCIGFLMDVNLVDCVLIK